MQKMLRRLHRCPFLSQVTATRLTALHIMYVLPNLVASRDVIDRDLRRLERLAYPYLVHYLFSSQWSMVRVFIEWS